MRPHCLHFSRELPRRDANGNRLSETTPDGTVASVYDAANRLVSVGGVTYTWDNNDNLLSDGTNTYTYDHSNHLTSVTQGSNVPRTPIMATTTG